MKKYIKPAIVEVQLENEAILAASLTVNPNARNSVDDRADDFELDWDEE